MAHYQEMSEELYEGFMKTAANIISYCDVEERKNALAELKGIVENNCIQEIKLKKAENVKDRLYNLYNQNDAETDHESVMQEYKKAISEIGVQVSQENKFLEYEQHIKTLLQGKGDSDSDSDSEDVRCRGGFLNVIDPISKKRIVDPVKNTVCGHTYDKETIQQMLKINKKTRCPVAGCKSKDYVSLKLLKTDAVMKAYLGKNPS